MDTRSTTSPDIVVLLSAKLHQWNRLIHQFMASGFLVVTAETPYDALYQLHTESSVHPLQRQYAAIQSTSSPRTTSSLHTSVLSAPIVNPEIIDAERVNTEVLVPQFMIWDETTFVQVNASVTPIPCSPIPSLFATVPHIVISQHPECFNSDHLLDIDLDFYPESAPFECLIEKIKFRVKRDRYIQKSSQPLSQKHFKENYLQESQSIVTLKQAKEKAESLSQAKSAFIAQMTHELKTPLNAILGFSEMLQQDPLLPANHKEQLGIINQSAEHLLSVINEILDLSRLEAGKLTVYNDEFNLHTLLHYLQEMFSLKAQEKGIDLIFKTVTPIPQFVRGDEQKLRQILINLLGNALKFTEQGSVILSTQVVMSPASPLHPQITFTLQDTGPGIAPEELASIFEPFIQSHTGRNLRQGTGLGLSISQKLAQLMGGEITVESQTVPPHQGTVFSVTLPFENSSTTSVNDFTVASSPHPTPSPLTERELTEELQSILPSPKDLDSTLLLSLNPSWLQELEIAASQANASHLAKLIDTLTPQQQPLANLLTYWLHNFRFDHIIHWIKQTQA